MGLRQHKAPLKDTFPTITPSFIFRENYNYPAVPSSNPHTHLRPALLSVSVSFLQTYIGSPSSPPLSSIGCSVSFVSGEIEGEKGCVCALLLWKLVEGHEECGVIRRDMFRLRLPAVLCLLSGGWGWSSGWSSTAEEEDAKPLPIVAIYGHPANHR